jgi:hypothetical protein
MSNCNIIILDCSNKEHLKLLKKYQKIESLQKSHFTKFLTLDADGCRNKKFIYFIATKPKTDTEEEQLCGVAQTQIIKKEEIVVINYLTSRAATDNSYKGTGTKIINKVTEYFTLNYPSLLGIELESAADAIEFYRKYGFINLSDSDETEMFYPFETYYKSNNKKAILNIANRINDKKTIDELIKNGLKLNKVVEPDLDMELDDYKYTNVTPFLVQNYFNQVKVDGNDFRDFYVENNQIDIIIPYIYHDVNYMKFINIKDIINFIKNVKDQKTIYKLLDVIYYSGYKFNEEILKSLLDQKILNKDAIKLVITSGTKITDKKYIDNLLTKLYKSKTSYEKYKAETEKYKNELEIYNFAYDNFTSN